MPLAFVNIAYLIAAALFILGLKGLAHPRTAVRGNILGALGMLIAIVVTLLQGKLSFELIIAGVVIGGLVGAVLAVKIEMTAMPQLVALFNGFGGGASVLVAGAELVKESYLPGYPGLQTLIAIVTSGIIGAVTFWGSLVAYGKLQGVVVPDRPVRYPGEQIVKVLLLLGSIALGVMVVINPDGINIYWLLVALASVLGVLLVIAIGGADMPVVIALLNSYSIRVWLLLPPVSYSQIAF
jgi:NAD(P) transhydrogenase subunit beta